MTARTWPHIPLSAEERVAFATLRLLTASGLLDRRWDDGCADRFGVTMDRRADHEAGKHEDHVDGCPLCEAEEAT